MMQDLLGGRSPAVKRMAVDAEGGTTVHCFLKSPLIVHKVGFTRASPLSRLTKRFRMKAVVPPPICAGVTVTALPALFTRVASSGWSKSKMAPRASWKVAEVIESRRDNFTAG